MKRDKSFEEIINEERVYSSDYFLKTLLRKMKELDSTLTNYLVEDYYDGEKVAENDLRKNLLSFTDLINYVVSSETLNNDFNGLSEDLKKYYNGNAEEHFEYTENIENAWYLLLKIKNNLHELSHNPNIRYIFNPGYNFGIGNCNFCSITVMYDKEISKNSYRAYTILNLSSNTGENVQVRKCKDYYELAGLDMKEYRQNIDVLKVFDKFKNTECVLYTADLINKFLEKVDVENNGNK